MILSRENMNTTIKLSLFTTLLLNTNLIANETLEPITITTATKTMQDIQNVTSNTEVITAEEIKERGYTTVTEALNSLAGVSFTSQGGVGQTTAVRLNGFNPENTLVLIDGIRYNDITSPSGASFENLMVTNIERIEVIKGAQSGVWGADAMGGVINIITKRAKKGINFQASQEFGTFNSLTTHTAGSYKNDDFYLQASQSRIDTKGISAQAPKNADIEQFEDDGYKNTTTNLKAGLAINETNKVDIVHTIIEADTQYDVTDPNDALSHSQSKTTLSQANFNHIDTFNEMNIFAKQTTFDRDTFSPYGNASFEGDVKEYGLTSKIAYRNSDFLLVGGDYKTFAHKNAIDKSYNNQALFITNSNLFEGIFQGKTIISESLRQDNYKQFDNKTTGKIGLKQSYGAIEGLTTSVNYGTAYNVPTLNELYTPFYGNTSLTPETDKSLDMTIQYHDLTLTYFDNKIKNMIDYDRVTYQNINTEGTSKIKGYTVAYNTTLFDEVAIGANYTNLDAKDKDGQDLKRRPKESIKLAIDYYGIERVHLGVNGEYLGKRDDLRFNPDYTTTDVDTGKYTIANFTANYAIDKHLSFYGKVENITDKYYQTVEGYATSPRAVYAGMRLTY